ncbi:FKBP-type peptidyl-prolyl cis-trans isomerase domain [Arabidopsis suecica]|uniref:peptidylprolyl isomerase n=1 Tax=Arabidopsis suecica TaxID=45249 RepID=A0A8T2B680_ARASU|nr:FKBP-type peptidyl-prolyl cis-trans isomerase domain [Arabidopsis suecica]
MAFWGVEVKPGKTFTLKNTEATGIRRLHLSQATLGHGTATIKSILQCNVGNKSPLLLCVLSPDKVDSCQLNLEFEETDEVIFSVIGPRSVHLTGYFLGRSTGFRPNDDESESYGEDIVDTDMEKGSSDDYDYSDSFINDDDPPGRGSHVSSTDDDEISIKEMAAKTKDKKKNGRGGRLRKKFQVSDSDSDETSARAGESSNEDSVEILNNGNEYKIAKVLSSESPLPSRVTRSKARSSTLENGEPNAKCEKTSDGRTHTHKTLDKRQDKSLGDVKLSPVQKGCEILSKKKRNKDRSKSSAIIINSDDEEGKNIPGRLQNEKPVTDEGIKSSSDVLLSQNGDATLSKKKRKRDRREETTDVPENLVECPEKKKQAIDMNIEKEAGTKKPLETRTLSNGVIIEEIEKGKLDGKSAVKGKKVSILYTGKLKDTGKLFDSNMGEAPLRFRLGGENVIEGLSIGAEGMRVGDKRRLIIPPSLGYSKKGLKEKVPKNAWLVYEVEAVKVR